MPWVFVVIWSTGFIVAKAAMPHAPPLGFLSYRFGFSALCFIAWAWLAKVSWPRDRLQWLHLSVTGALMQAGYLGGVWTAVKAGIGAGTVALLVGLQPVLTAIWISHSNSRANAGRAAAPDVSSRQWLGLALGLGGIALVVWRKLGAGELNAVNLSLAAVALLGITVGTLYQKRFVQPCDVRSAGTVQMIAALVLCLPLALLETEPFRWHPHLVAAMAWSVLVLTLGGSSLFYLLIQRGEATAVTSVMYLVPPCTALMAWALFDEVFTPFMWLGMIFTVIGVALVVRPAPSSDKVRDRRSGMPTDR